MGLKAAIQMDAAERFGIHEGNVLKVKPPSKEYNSSLYYNLQHYYIETPTARHYYRRAQHTPVEYLYSIDRKDERFYYVLKDSK